MDEAAEGYAAAIAIARELGDSVSEGIWFDGLAMLRLLTGDTARDAGEPLAGSLALADVSLGQRARLAAKGPGTR